MTKNMGSLDRILRGALGVVLLYVAFAVLAAGVLKWVAVVVGVVMLATALTSICPLYSVIGIKTCRTS